MNTFDENILIGDIYDAALSASLWRKVLADICKFTSSEEGSILFYDSQNRRRNFVITAFNENNDDFVRNHIDAEVQGLRRLFFEEPSGTVFSKPQIVDKLQTSYEEQLGEPANVPERSAFEAKVGISLINGKNIISAMGFHSRRDQPDLSTESIRILKILTPHLMQAIRIHNHITSLKTTFNNLYSVLNAADYGVFLLEKSGEVLFSNNEASRMIEAKCGLAFAKGGVLHHSDIVDNTKLQNSIRLLAEVPKEPNFEDLNLTLAHANSNFPLQLNLLPIHHEHARHFATSGASIAVFVKDPNKPLSISSEYLKEAYQLTNTEIEVAQLLLNNPDVGVIAEQRHTSLETIRGHIKQLMQKTKTHSKAELVSLLACICSEI